MFLSILLLLNNKKNNYEKYGLALFAILFVGCANDNVLGNLASEERINENPSSFKEIGSLLSVVKELLK
jgi:hypothetical protein